GAVLQTRKRIIDRQFQCLEKTEPVFPGIGSFHRFIFQPLEKPLEEGCRSYAPCGAIAPHDMFLNCGILSYMCGKGLGLPGLGKSIQQGER
ncbi:hypothetical protein P4B35_08410, partial [Pontiellaceae bacterium B12227]|nr:hypothetical protein [Pontiellaceae bacterium B12227]